MESMGEEAGEYQGSCVLGDDPSKWPSSDEVVAMLLPVLDLVGSFVPLAVEDCQKLAWLFVFPNVAHWTSQLQNTIPATPYRETCPISCSDEEDCRDSGADFTAPKCVAPEHRSDFCRDRLVAHPWSLQISLLENHLRRKQSQPTKQKPARTCAWEVYSHAIDQKRSAHLWRHVRPRRSKALKEAWEAWAVEEEQAIDLMPLADQEDAPQEWAARFAMARALVRIVLQHSSALDGWVRKQRSGEAVPIERLDEGMRALLGVMLLWYRMEWAFPAHQFRKEIDAFTDLLQELDVPNREDIATILRETNINVICQRVVLEYMRDVVWPYRESGLPPQPLDDTLFQDLFWHQVGRGFDLAGWAKRRWGRPPSGASAPNWSCGK